MLDNLGMLCILGFILLMVFMVLPRLMGGAQGMPRRGNLRPEYDDPNIRSRTGIGNQVQATRPGEEMPRYDSPEIQSRSGFGRPRGASRLTNALRNVRPAKPLQPRRRNEPRSNNPNIQSRSGFGRDRD